MKNFWMELRFKASIKSVIKTLYLAFRSCTFRAFGFLLHKEHPSPPEDLRNILFIRMDRIGDMVLSIPAFTAIKTAWPWTHLTILSSRASAAVLKNNPHVDEIIICDSLSSPMERLRLVRGLREHRFDLAIDPYDDYELKTAWIAWMSGATHRVGYAAYGREIFLNGPTPTIKAGKHITDVTFDLLKRIGIPSSDRQPVIYLDDAEQSGATTWLKENKLQNKKLIAVHPGAYYETQRWPTEYYADLIHSIHDRTEAEVIIFGGPTDAALIDDILRRINEPVCTAVQADLRKFFALLSRCRLLVCNNSGPLHCAVALNVPTISLMGPTIKERWTPSGEKHHVLRKDDLPCIGCNLGTCKIDTHECLRGITPDKVFKIVRESIDG